VAEGRTEPPQTDAPQEETPQAEPEQLYRALRAALEGPEGAALTLWWAVEAGDPAGIHRAAERGADLNAAAGTALLAERGGEPPAGLLSDVAERTPQHSSAAPGEAATVSAQSAPAWASQEPLHAAAARGYTRVVRALVSLGAIVDVRNAEGFTPLHFAAFNSQTLAAVHSRSQMLPSPKRHASAWR